VWPLNEDACLARQDQHSAPRAPGDDNGARATQGSSFLLLGDDEMPKLLHKLLPNFNLIPFHLLRTISVETSVLPTCTKINRYTRTVSAEQWIAGQSSKTYLTIKMWIS
jgi:hypothetical protein